MSSGGGGGGESSGGGGGGGGGTGPNPPHPTAPSPVISEIKFMTP